MTLNKIQIGAFGKLENYTLEFSDGFQMIYGDNEDGKTTVMTFLRMMFYGNHGKTARTFRKKYQPWSGRTMGGSVFFSHNGHRYCLEREFRGSDATDRVVLRDLDLGTAENVASDIGSRFFGLSAGAFERSVFIGQSGGIPADGEAEGELNNRLSNLVLTGEEDVSYQTVNGRLETAGVRLISPRHVGLYDKGLAELKNLHDRREESERLTRRREELNNQSAELKTRLTAVKKRYEEVKQTVDREQDVRNAEKLREYLSRKRELDVLYDAVRLDDGKPFDELFLGKINFCLSKYHTEFSRLVEKTNDRDALQNEIIRGEQSKTAAGEERLNLLQNQLAQAEETRREMIEKIRVVEREEQEKTNHFALLKERKKPFQPFLFTAGVLLLAAAILLWFFSPTVAYLCGGVSFICLLFGFIFRPTDKKAVLKAERELATTKLQLAEQKTALAEVSGRISVLTRELTELRAARNADEAVLNEKKLQLSKLSAAVETAEQAAKAEELALCELFGRYQAVDSAATVEERLPELTEKVNAQKSLKLKLKYLSDDLGNISYEEAEEKLRQTGGENIDPHSFDQARAELEELNEQGQTLTAKLSEVLTELRTGFSSLTSPESIRTQITELETHLHEQKTFYDALQTAKEFLTDSFAELHQGYGAALEQETLNIFAHLTDGRYQAISVSPSLTLSAQPADDFSARETDLLSLGTADQAYLSLRLALSKLLCRENPLPIVLDDVLAQYDDARAERALMLLREYAEQSQVLFFTCHQTLCEMAKRSDIPITPLH